MSVITGPSIYRKRFSATTLTSTTGATLTPTPGELKPGVVDPTSIELTYTLRPSFILEDGVYEVTIKRL